MRLCDKTIVLLLTARAGLLDDLCGLLLCGSKLRGVRGLLLFGLGETLVRLIERVRHLLRTVIEHFCDGSEQEFLHQHEQDEQINKHPDNLRI